MPEIWLNYGKTDIVLDIRAENLDQTLNTDGTTLTESQLASKLEEFDVSKPTEIVVLNASKSVQKILLAIFEKCIQKSCPKPQILADKSIMNVLKTNLSQESSVLEFENTKLSNSNLVFVGEMEFDGLFGFESIATRLTKKFGEEQMLLAYEKRKGNLPVCGQKTECLEIAQRFTDMFEIKAIEILGNSNGIVDLAIGHPSKTDNISKTFVSMASKQVEKHRTLMISTGKDASNDTLARSLTSLWNCHGAIRDDGFAFLLAECQNGIGSDAIQQYIEGRMSLDRLREPAKYIQGMEDLLFLTEIQKRIKVGLVSILPEFYAKKLGIMSFAGIKLAMDHVLKTQGIKQKVAVVSDGARILLN